MKCPACGDPDDRVVDSRLVDDGTAVRRRRECLSCGRRYTTFERLEGEPLWVIKRSGRREPFDREKVVSGLRAATKNRPVSELEMAELAGLVEEAMRSSGPAVKSEQIGLEVLDRLRGIDEVAYLRFASVYKEFEQADDFYKEVGLLSKATAPKHRGMEKGELS